MCMTAFQRKDGQYCPCGRCPECKARRASAWSFRLMQQEKVSLSSYFLTLTYDTANVPITKNGFMSLDKRDLQLFFKRLRKIDKTTGSLLKYYAVGEYGGRSRRPHYHVIAFSTDVSKIQSAWKLGSVHYGTVTGASVGYTLKYITKKSSVPMHINDDRVREFSLMSKGLGACYLNEKMLKWHKDDLGGRVYVAIEGGKKITMPRYYKDRIYDSEERGYLKGYFEKVNEVRNQKMILQGEVPTERDRREAVKAAFKEMELADIGHNKI